MMTNLVTSLLEHESIQTTDARAKELRKAAERVITLGKRALRSAFPQEISDAEYSQKRLHLYRQILQAVRNKDVAKRVIDVYASRYVDRPGGYTRIMKLGRRNGDNAPISIIELVDRTSTST